MTAEASSRPSSAKPDGFGRSYRDGGALDVEALCVVGGEACWQVALNVSLLIDRGNASVHGRRVGVLEARARAASRRGRAILCNSRTSIASCLYCPCP